MAGSIPTNLVVKALGLGAGAWLSGNIVSISQVTIPALQRSKSEDGVSSTTLALQWQRIFDRGKAQAPPFAALTAASYFYLAWASRPLADRTPLLLYSAGAILTMSIAPFTAIFMNKTNNAISAHVAWSKGGSKEFSKGKRTDSEIDNLLTKWKGLNAVRSILPLMGCVLAFTAW